MSSHGSGNRGLSNATGNKGGKIGRPRSLSTQVSAMRTHAAQTRARAELLAGEDRPSPPQARRAQAALDKEAGLLRNAQMTLMRGGSLDPSQPAPTPQQARSARDALDREIALIYAQSEGLRAQVGGGKAAGTRAAATYMRSYNSEMRGVRADRARQAAEAATTIQPTQPVSAPTQPAAATTRGRGLGGTLRAAVGAVRNAAGFGPIHVNSVARASQILDEEIAKITAQLAQVRAQNGAHTGTRAPWQQQAIDASIHSFQNDVTLLQNQRAQLQSGQTPSRSPRQAGTRVDAVLRALQSVANGTSEKAANDQIKALMNTATAARSRKK